MTASYLRNAAMHYLSARSASTSMLRQTLERRAQKRLGQRQLPEETRALIDTAIADLVGLGMVDDTAFARTRARTLAGRGLSKQRIAQGLQLKGIPGEAAKQAIDPELDDLAQAKRFAERKRLGPWRRGAPTPEIHAKELRSLARAGFSYAIASKALSDDDA